MCDWTEVRGEPLLADMLADPIVQALMQRDRVEHRDIELMVEQLRVRREHEARAPL